jgi:hypothetical protein
MGEAAARRTLSARALAIAVLVPLAGAVVGLAGFRFEQMGAVWRPSVFRGASGWVIQGRTDDTYSNPALSGSHAAWDDGAFTLVADLTSGSVKLIGAARDARSRWQPSVSGRFVTWVELGSSSQSATSFTVYDLRRRRRTHVTDTAGIWLPPEVSGTVAYWVDGATRGSSAQTTARLTLVGQDLVTGRRFTVAPWQGSGDMVVAGGLAAWVQVTPATYQVSIVVQALAGGHRWQIPLSASNAGTLLDEIALSGHTVVWRQSQDSMGTAQILAQNVDTGRRIAVADGANVGTMAFDGDLVAWAATSPSGTTIMGRRLSGGSVFTLTRSGFTVDQLFLSGDTVMIVGGGGLGLVPQILTARVPS